MNLIQGLMPKGVTPVLGPDASAVGQVYWYTLEGGTIWESCGRCKTGSSATS
jgi:Cu/Ag efflux pump CusA